MTDTTAARLGAASLAAVIDALPHGVAVLDGDGIVCYLNPVAARLLQRDSGELIGRAITAAVPEFGAALLDEVGRARATGAPGAWTARCTPTGSWLTITVAPVGDLVQLTFSEVAALPVPRVPDAPLEHPAPVHGDGPAHGDAEKDRLAYLARVTEVMTGSLDIRDAVTHLAELVVPRLCDWAIAVVVGDDREPDEEGRAHRDAAGRIDVDIYRDGRLRVSNADNPMTRALLTGQPVRLDRLDGLPIASTLTTDEVRAAWKRLDTSSATIVPLRARGETFGALAMMMSGTRPPHTDADVATGMEVSRRASMSLDNARLYGRQLKIAETLQRSLLTPPVDGEPDQMELAVRYRPAALHQAVGGDWYDSFRQRNGATVLVIGDVVGHSVEAAATMSVMRNMLRALAHDRPGSPAATLTRLDRVLTGLHIDSLATALVARLEPTTAPGGPRTLRWSSAGHPPPFLLHADGSVDALERRPERLLGTDWSGRRTEHEVALRPGDTLLLVTDGLIEHGRLDIDEGTARLCRALGALADLPVDDLCDRLLESIVAGRPDDDVAVLALRCHDPREPRSAHWPTSAG